jgi:hypothetical protein
MTYQHLMVGLLVCIRGYGSWLLLLCTVYYYVGYGITWQNNWLSSSFILLLVSLARGVEFPSWCLFRRTRT